MFFLLFFFFKEKGKMISHELGRLYEYDPISELE